MDGLRTPTRPLLKLAEEFHSLQGEGHLTGKPTYFIRLAGCAVTSCPLHPANKARVGECDTDWRYRTGTEDYAALVERALRAVGPRGWVCITGGEPLDQPEAIALLIAELQRVGLLVNIQTSGTRWVTCPWDWLTVSPKVPAAELTQTFGQELKVVYTGQSDDELRAYHATTRFWNYYLMPLWHDGKANTEATIAAVHRLGHPWEFTMQAHKVWGVR